MDEVSSYVRLDPAELARPPNRLFHLILESHDGTAYAPIPERSPSPRATLTTAVVDSLKALDLNRPIRETDIARESFLAWKI